jgi:hypothetical protein
LWRGYAAAATIVGSVLAWLCWVVWGTSARVPAEALIAPMMAQFWLTALVWLGMVVVRNRAVIRGTLSVRYFVAYQTEAPDERVERPARAFDNLMQVPTLFYVVCLLMLVTKQADSPQVTLAWTFVVLRALHAALLVALNRVPYRFALWASSCIVLGVTWYRFAILQSS